MSNADTTLQFRITGMHCGACAGRIERAVREIDGVTDASVNLLAESAAVTVNDRSLSNAIIQKVRDAGYDAETAGSGNELVQRLASDRDQNEKLRRHRQALVQAIGLSLPVIGLDYLIPTLWGDSPAAQAPARLMQIVLLIMFAVSPAGAPILVGGLRAIIHRAPNMDLLISVGVVAAFISGVYGTIAQDPSFIHFHAAAMILAIVCVGRYLEARARGRATGALSALAKRAPKETLVRRDDRWQTVPVDRVERGDVVRIPSQAGIPVDGDIIEGTADVDESLLTGEPMPVTKGKGDAVSAGTMVTDGQIDIRTTMVGRAAALGRIAELVEKAQHGHTRMQRLADQVAAVFTPIIIAIAVGTFVVWILAMGWAHASHGARAALAVLVVACPCALGLATPTATMVATGLAALRGILVRDAETLERMGRIDTVVWDKTGTLTAGRPRVVNIKAVGSFDEATILQLAAGAEQFTQHPLAKAIVQNARQRDLEIPDPTESKSLAGQGVVATIDGQRIVIGNRKLLSNENVKLSDGKINPANQRSTATRVFVAIEGAHVGTIEIEDTIRPSAATAIERLDQLKIDSHMLTGDAEPTAQSVAGIIGIANDHIRAGVSPQDKHEAINSLRKNGHRVAMIGDGVNDAAALAAADVGVAFATGADIAVATADVSLIGSTPMLVADTIVIARLAVRVIRQNLFWAFFYNVLMIPLAATGHVPPALAAGAMMLSSLTVVLNALRLPRMMRKRDAQRMETVSE